MQAFEKYISLKTIQNKLFFGCPTPCTCIQFCHQMFHFVHLRSFELYKRKESVTSEPTSAFTGVKAIMASETSLQLPDYYFAEHFSDTFYILRLTLTAYYCHSPNPQFHIRLRTGKPRWFLGAQSPRLAKDLSNLFCTIYNTAAVQTLR